MPADLSKIKDEPRIGFVEEHGRKKWRGPLLVRPTRISKREADRLAAVQAKANALPSRG